MQNDKAALNLSPLAPPFVHQPALASGFCVNWSKHPPPSLSEGLYFMAGYASSAYSVFTNCCKDIFPIRRDLIGKTLFHSSASERNTQRRVLQRYIKSWLLQRRWVGNKDSLFLTIFQRGSTQQNLLATRMKQSRWYLIIWPKLKIAKLVTEGWCVCQTKKGVKFMEEKSIKISSFNR